MDDLVTERLVLHPMSPAEAERVTAGEPSADDLWAAGYPAEGDMSATRRYLTTCAITGDPQPFGPYEIRLREDGRAIGGIDFQGAPDEDGAVTIGYGLVPEAQGEGYASESLRALLVFARASGVVTVKGDTNHDNTASQHVMAAAGMRIVAEDEQCAYYRISWSDPAREGTGSGSDGGAALSSR